MPLPVVESKQVGHKLPDSMGQTCGRVSGISAFASINGQRRYLLKIRKLAYFGAGEAASCWKR
jgi:hypothetical protein